METNKSKNIQKKKNWKKIVIIFSIIIVSVLSWAELTKAGYIPNFLNLEILCSEGNDNQNNPEPVVDYKPVIYLYPERKQDIQVQLDYKGKIIADYPSYDEKLKGWSITAYPDGKIINGSDNQEYSYLFWEGQREEKIDWDLSKGFIVKGKDTKEFLQKTLSKIGLTPKEYNEFIVYWYPLLQNNNYNLIHFADEQYTDNAILTINPKPNSILRVFMVYKPLEEPIKIEEQEIKPFERNGFTVIEWGGTKAE
jgi:hypothetical protein